MGAGQSGSVGHLMDVGALFTLEPHGPDTFVGAGPRYPWGGLYGGQIVARVLSDPQLRTLWEGEVEEMRERILAMRNALHDTLSAMLPGRDFRYFLTQRGMFSYTGLSAAQVDRLREEFGVYLVRSGRICVAGLNTGNVERTAVAMAAVLGS